MSCTIARVLETLIKTNSYSKQDGKWVPGFAPNLHSDSPQADAEMDIALFFNQVSACIFPDGTIAHITSR